MKLLTVREAAEQLGFLPASSTACVHGSACATNVTASDAGPSRSPMTQSTSSAEA